MRAFAIGSPSEVSCTGPTGQDLNTVAAKGGAGSGCQQVTDPSTLGDEISAAVGSTLSSVEIDVDSGGYNAIPAVDLTGVLPMGPNFNNKSVDWSTEVTNLGPGFHDICVRASGSDAGGSGSVEECKTIQLLQLQSGAPGGGLEATNELGEDNEHTVSVVVAGDVGGTDVTFEVDGVNGPDGDTVQTDAGGNASFTFTSPQDPSGLGDDTIEVSITIGDATQSLEFTKHWVDTTPPVADCVPSVNPAGNEPSAPGKGGQGQNQDGFYVLEGTDDIWPAEELEMFVVDDGSGTVFGPYPVGTNIKYVEDDDAIPEAKAKNGKKEVDYHIKGNGDALVVVVDGSGNESDAVACLVPPAPK